MQRLKMRSQAHQISLIYLPISNQEAEWLKEDPEVQQILSESQLYFIGQKPESIFAFEENIYEKVKRTKKIPFKIELGELSDEGEINIEKLISTRNLNLSETNLKVELGKKLIRIWDIGLNDAFQEEKRGEYNLLEWYTTEKMITDRSFEPNHLEGLNNYKSFTCYHLHYIGISKKEDSLKRLVIKPHDKRLRILSNEHPLEYGSRLTDELILFFFNIESIEIKQHELEDNIFDFGKNELEDKIRIIADAEKAFVKILDTQYNVVKFKKYPISYDGLYNSSVERYSYSINNDLTFITPNNKIRGKRNVVYAQSAFDFIAIDKKDETVELIKIE